MSPWSNNMYLVNNLSGDAGCVSNLCTKIHGSMDSHGREVYETWDESKFLEACGFSFNLIKLTTKIKVMKKSDLIIGTYYKVSTTLNTQYKLIGFSDSGTNAFLSFNGVDMEDGSIVIKVSKLLKINK